MRYLVDARDTKKNGSSPFLRRLEPETGGTCVLAASPLTEGEGYSCINPPV